MTTITMQDGSSIFCKDLGPRDALIATHPELINADLLAFIKE